LLERSELAVIIPAFNESATITQVVTSILTYGQAIVVDDCSTDNTATLAKAAGAIVVNHSKNLGYDTALNSGFAKASHCGYSYAVTFDADGQHNHTLVKQYLSYLQKDHDLVLGIRPHYARIAELLFAVYTRKRFGWHDPLCGMKGYRMSLYKERGWFDSYKSIGTELAFYGILKNKKFIQIPISIVERKGIPKFGQRWIANYKIFRAMLLSFIKRSN